MTDNQPIAHNPICQLSGQLSRRRIWLPLRVLFAVTGIALLRAVGTLALRFLLRFTTRATVALEDRQLTIRATRQLLGRPLQTAQIIVPKDKVLLIQLENQFQAAHLVVGVGFLVVGLFCGVHWLLDGLGAGYPALFLLGAGVIAAGIAIDMILSLVVPNGEGRTSVRIVTAGWRFTVKGVSQPDAESFAGQAATWLFGASTGPIPMRSTPVVHESAAE